MLSIRGSTEAKESLRASFLNLEMQPTEVEKTDNQTTDWGRIFRGFSSLARLNFKSWVLYKRAYG